MNFRGQGVGGGGSGVVAPGGTVRGAVKWIFFIFCAEQILNYRHNKRKFNKLLSFLCAFARLRKKTISFVMSVCLSAWINSAPNGRTFMKFGI